MVKKFYQVGPYSFTVMAAEEKTDEFVLAPEIVITGNTGEEKPQQLNDFVDKTTESHHNRSTSESSHSPHSDTEDDNFYDAVDGPKVGAENGKGKSVKDEANISDTKSTLLSPELKEKIVTQAEFYFSDDNLMKDGFLLKHVKRNKEGYVNLKLLSSFKKMRTLSKDYRVIAEALKDSARLLVNDQGTKVKRKNPLPKTLSEQVPVRFLVVSNIPAENPSMDFVSDAFPDKELLVSIRIIRSGKKVPNDLQAHFAHHPELANENVAVVEFETPELASQNSLIDFSGSEKYKDMKIALLELGPKQGTKRIKRGDDTATGSEQEESSAVESESRPKCNRSKKERKKPSNRVRELGLSGDDSYASSSDNENTSPFGSYKRRYKFKNDGIRNSSPASSPQSSPVMPRKGRYDDRSPASSPQSSPWSNRKFPDRSMKKGNSTGALKDHRLGLSPLARDSSSPYSSPEARRKILGDKMVKKVGSAPNSPWVLRRLNASKDQNDNIDDMKGKLNEFGLIRQPRGPDGTKGFIFHPFRNNIAAHA